jgi:hypothetical protein
MSSEASETGDSAGDAAVRETLRAAVRHADAGRPEEAERLFEAALAATRGAGTKLERLACSSLVSFFTRQGRDVELLLMARRHVELAAAASDEEDVCWSLGGLTHAYAQLEDWRRFDPAAARFERALVAHDGPTTPRLRRSLLRLLAERALAAGDVESARRQLGRSHDFDLGDESPFEMRAALLAEAEIALFKGSPGLACEALDRIAALDAPGGAEALATALLAAVCAVELKGPEAAAVVARCTLDLIESPAARRNGTSARIRCAKRLGDLVAARCGDRALAERAYDVAASVVLLRGEEMERAVRRLPEISAATADDFEALAEYRARFAEQERELRRAVARLIRGRLASGDAPNWSREPGRAVTDVCAWCLRVRLADGTMLPVGHFLNKDAGLALNHAICSDCEERVAASA